MWSFIKSFFSKKKSLSDEWFNSPERAESLASFLSYNSDEEQYALSKEFGEARDKFIKRKFK